MRKYFAEISIPLSILFFLFPGKVCYCQESFAKGEITEIVECLTDTTEGYALYLPSIYNDTASWPIIYIFEPGARAMIPVRKYKDIAEEFGYILVCSYNAHNGPWDPVIRSINAMYEDTYQRFALDLNRMAAMGFSGGARAAGMMAIASGRINTVIACGAGYPASLNPTSYNDFHWTGIVGWKDMNYLEMLSVDSAICNKPNGNQLLFYDGYHDWPDVDIMREAFLLFEANARRDNLTSGNIEAMEGQFNGLSKNSYFPACNDTDLFLVNQYNRKMVNYLHGLSDMNVYDDEVNQLSQSWQSPMNNPEFGKRIALEKKLQDSYSTALMDIALTSLDTDRPVKSFRWWLKQNEFLQDQIRSASCEADKNIYIRLHEYIWRNAWEQHYVFMKQKKYLTAKEYLDVCEAVLPDEAWPMLRQSVIYLKLGENDMALSRLKKAAEKGFADVSHLDKNPDFDEIRSSKKYQKIRNIIEQNASNAAR